MDNPSVGVFDFRSNGGIVIHGVIHQVVKSWYNYFVLGAGTPD